MENNNIMSSLPDNVSLSNVLLPFEWVVYLYDKQLFKKMADKPAIQGKPYKELCTIKNLNELVYLIKIMKAKHESKTGAVRAEEGRINLDANDYIIMRKGIEPLWEDPKNSNGGMFSVKLEHTKGFNLWMTLMCFIVGNSMDTEFINGISVSYISDAYNSQQNGSSSYIKIWDGKPDRTRNNFIEALPKEIYALIKDESTQYAPNNKKNSFNKESILNKLKSQSKQYRYYK